VLYFLFKTKKCRVLREGLVYTRFSSNKEGSNGDGRIHTTSPLILKSLDTSRLRGGGSCGGSHSPVLKKSSFPSSLFLFFSLLTFSYVFLLKRLLEACVFCVHLFCTDEKADGRRENESEQASTNCSI